MDRTTRKIIIRNFIKDFFDPASFKQFKKYLIVGILSFIAEYSLFFILVEVIDLWFILSNTIVYSFIFFFNFILNRKWSFESKSNIKTQVIKYGLLFLFNLIATNALLFFLADTLTISPLIAKIMVMALIVPWNFVMYKKVIYK